MGVGGDLGITFLKKTPYGAKWGMVTSDIGEAEDTVSKCGSIPVSQGTLGRIMTSLLSICTVETYSQNRKEP